MTDMKCLHTSTEYAVRGFYKYLYNFIPCNFRIHYDLDEAVSCMGEFYDQDLTYENRLKYKVTSIKYTDRKTPWLALMWNNDGLQPADNHFRKLPVRVATQGKIASATACYVKMAMNIAVVSNSKTALDEFQEMYLLNIRPDDCAISAEHPLLKDFNVSVLDIATSNVTKLPRTDGTLSQLVLSTLVHFPIIGCVNNDTHLIETLNMSVRNFEDLELAKIKISDYLS